MTDYTPKVGDRVTVVGDDRVFLVTWASEVDDRVVIKNGAVEYFVPRKTLTPVPTPPPEPPKYVRHAGRFYTRGGQAEPYIEPQAPVLIDPADDAQVKAAGLCRADEVAAWMRNGFATIAAQTAFVDRFGGDGDE